MMNLETRAPLAGLGEMAVVSMAIPEGDGGTEATIAAMRGLIDEGKKDPLVYELAREILAKACVRAFDWEGEARAIYQAVLRNVRFTRDIRGKETLHAPREIIRLRMGDCDDFTVLLCSLLESVGHRTRIVTVASDASEPDVFTHVFPEVKLGGNWVALDAARRQAAFGRRPRCSYRTRFWDTQSPEFIEISGLNGLSTRTPPNRLPRAWSPRNAPWLQNLGALGCNGRRRCGAPASSYGAPQGMGHYGPRALRALSGLGDGFDLSTLPGLIQSATTGTANIITAERAAPTNLVPSTTLPSAYNPYGSAINPLAAVGAIDPTWLLLGGGLLLAVVAMRRS